MTARRRVLVLGASGMIGRAVRAMSGPMAGIDWLPASHRELPGFLHIDYASLVEPAAWSALLTAHRLDTVVNCVGIWNGSVERFERLQYTVPVALFEACGSLGVRVVHVSALGFSVDSTLPYASTKARADRHLLANVADAVVVYPSLVFGRDGNSSRFFMNLAALPVQVDMGLPENLQPVHVDDVARAVVRAVLAERPPRTIECAGTHVIGVPAYFSALRTGMGLGKAWWSVRLPRSLGQGLFEVGERLGLHFVNRQTWTLLQDGTRSEQDQPEATPYTSFATADDLNAVRETRLYAFARAAMAFLWLWTAFVTAFIWPQAETLSWLDRLSPGLGTPFWLWVSCALDAGLGIACLTWPRTRLWQAQLAVTSVYSVGLLAAMPVFAVHPFGPLTKNLAVMATLAFLVICERKRGR